MGVLIGHNGCFSALMGAGCVDARRSCNGPVYVLMDVFSTPMNTFNAPVDAFSTPMDTCTAKGCFLVRQWAPFSAQLANGCFLAHQWALLKQVVLRIGVDSILNECFRGAGCVLRIIVVSSRCVSTECYAETKICS